MSFHAPPPPKAGLLAQMALLSHASRPPNLFHLPSSPCGEQGDRGGCRGPGMSCGAVGRVGRDSPRQQQQAAAAVGRRLASLLPLCRRYTHRQQVAPEPHAAPELSPQPAHLVVRAAVVDDNVGHNLDALRCGKSAESKAICTWLCLVAGGAGHELDALRCRQSV